MSSGPVTGLRVLVFTLVALIAAFALLINTTYEGPNFGDEVRLDEVFRFADQGRIVSARLLDEDAYIVGTLCTAPGGGGPAPAADPATPPALPAPAQSCPEEARERFQASYPSSDVTTQQLIERIAAKSALTVDKQTGKAISKLIVTFVLPLVILANLFGIIFLSRSGESSMADIVGFGRIGRQRQRKRQAGTGVTFADIAGADEPVAELREVTDYLADPKKYKAYGAAAPKGVLLFGPPGCGKTLLARAVAGESGVPFFSMSGAEFIESLVGVGAARVRDLFRQVRAVAPAIVFLDEIDAVGRRRGGENESGGEREQTVNQLLVEMDGFDTSSGIVVIGATNRPDILDPGLLRPGRFDRHVTLEPPDIQGRLKILKLHARGKPIAADVDLETVARRTPGFTGADLANVINEAALLTIREGGKKAIHAGHLSEAIQRVLHGPQRRGRLMTAEERKRVAFHESGHALASAALGRHSEIDRISIVARGRGLGQSVTSAERERLLLTKSEMEAELVITMAGIAAEQIAFGEISTTSESDIDRANEIARQMVGRYGMSPEIRWLRVLAKPDGSFLDGDSQRVESVSSKTLQDFDEEVKRLIEAAEDKATSIHEQHRAHLDAMAEDLERHETLEGRELERFLTAIRPEILPAGYQPANASTLGRPPFGRE